MRRLLTPSNLVLGLLSVSIIALLVYIYRNHNYIEAISRPATGSVDATAMAYGDGTDAQDKTAVGQYPVAAEKARYLTTILRLRSLVRAEIELAGTTKHIELPELPLTDQLVAREEQFYTYYGSFLDSQRLSQEEEDVFKMLMIQRWNLLSDINRSALRLVKAPPEKREKTEARNRGFMQEFEEMLRSFLGDTICEEYRQYQMGEPMRVAVDRIDEFLNPEDKLSGEQRQLLIDAFDEEMRNYQSERLHNQDLLLAAEFSRQMEEEGNRIHEMTRIHERYINSARRILTESQLQQLRTFFAGAREKIASHDSDR